MYKPAPEPPYRHREPTSIGNILLLTGAANVALILIALFVRSHLQYINVALFVLGAYPIIVFLESIWVHGLVQKYVFYALSFVLLLIVALITTAYVGFVPRFTFPEIVTQWHFYIYYPLIMPYLSHKLSELLFRID